MKSNKQHTGESSDENLEKVSIKPLLYLTSIVSLVIFLLSFYPYLFIYKLHLIKIFSCNFSYVITYLILFFILLVGLIIYYRHLVLHMEEMSKYVRIFGLNPEWLITRTGNKGVDWVGFLAGLVLCIISLVCPKTFFFFPGFLFFTLSFFFALLLGNPNKWKLLRRS
jgi:hypothetical protein